MLSILNSVNVGWLDKWNGVEWYEMEWRDDVEWNGVKRNGVE